MSLPTSGDASAPQARAGNSKAMLTNRMRRIDSSIICRQAVQLFRRYPVLKIQATTPRQARKKPSVNARLSPTLTSEVSKKLQRKPLIRYTTGLNRLNVRQAGGSMLIE